MLSKLASAFRLGNRTPAFFCMSLLLFWICAPPLRVHAILLFSLSLSSFYFYFLIFFFSYFSFSTFFGWFRYRIHWLIGWATSRDLARGGGCWNEIAFAKLRKRKSAGKRYKEWSFCPEIIWFDSGYLTLFQISFCRQNVLFFFSFLH